MVLVIWLIKVVLIAISWYGLCIRARPYVRLFIENCLTEFHVTEPDSLLNCFAPFSAFFLSGKIIYLVVLGLFRQKYIDCGAKLNFQTIFGHCLPISWCFFCWLFVIEKKFMDKTSSSFDKNSSFWTNFCSKYWPSLLVRYLAVFLKLAYI